MRSHKLFAAILALLIGSVASAQNRRRPIHPHWRRSTFRLTRLKSCLTASPCTPSNTTNSPWFLFGWLSARALLMIR